MTTLLITGTNRGIGLAMAKNALERGWTVYGSARNGMTGPAAALTDHPDFRAMSFDVTDHGAVQKAAAEIDTPIDILINNAGIIDPAGHAADLEDYEGFARTLAVNTIAPLAVTRAFLPHLKKSNAGRVIMISSSMGSLSYAKSDHIAYRTSKTALNKVMQGLATDLAPAGIAVCSVHPGWVQTDMGGASADITPETSAAGILALAERLEMKRTGRFFNWDGSSAAW